MKVKQVSNIPTSGQYVVIWEFDGVPWCDTFKYDGFGNLMVYRQYDLSMNEFVPCEPGFPHPNQKILAVYSVETEEKKEKETTQPLVVGDRVIVWRPYNAPTHNGGIIFWVESMTKYIGMEAIITKTGAIEMAGKVHYSCNINVDNEKYFWDPKWLRPIGRRV